MAGVLTPGRHRKCMSRIRSRNTKPSVRNEHLNGALFTLNHLFLENFAVRHAVSYGTDICYFLLQNDDKNVNVSIYTLNGTEIYSRYMGNINAGEQNQLDLSDLAAGIYFIHITGDKTNMTTKLTVK